MSSDRPILIPEIGDFDDVDVAELLVSAGDRVEMEDSLLVLESDKASMEIPSPVAGIVTEMKVAVGDKVNQGALLALIEVEGDAVAKPAETPTAVDEPPAQEPQPTPSPAEPARDAAPDPIPPPTRAADLRPVVSSVVEDREGVEVVPVLRQRGPRYVYVLGEVVAPGRYTLEAPTTVMQAISMAGSWPVGAHLTNVVVFRRGDAWRLIATKLNWRATRVGRPP